MREVPDPFWETNDNLRVIRNEIKIIVQSLL